LCQVIFTISALKNGDRHTTAVHATGFRQAQWTTALIGLGFGQELTARQVLFALSLSGMFTIKEQFTSFSTEKEKNDLPNTFRQ
jgi:hypothetical protein